VAPQLSHPVVIAHELGAKVELGDDVRYLGSGEKAADDGYKVIWFNVYTCRRTPLIFHSLPMCKEKANHVSTKP
jgi:hypothetical protein